MPFWKEFQAFVDNAHPKVWCNKCNCLEKNWIIFGLFEMYDCLQCLFKTFWMIYHSKWKKDLSLITADMSGKRTLDTFYRVICLEIPTKYKGFWVLRWSRQKMDSMTWGRAEKIAEQIAINVVVNLISVIFNVPWILRRLQWCQKLFANRNSM